MYDFPLKQEEHQLSAIDTITSTIALYQKPESRISVEQQLMTLLRMIDLLNAKGETFHRHALEQAETHVAGLRDLLRSALGALIGPLMGSVFPEAMRSIEEKIHLHQLRIEMFVDVEDTDWGAIYDRLKATDLPMALERQTFIDDAFERDMVRQGEVWIMGQLEYKKRELKGLFMRFVRTGENL